MEHSTEPDAERVPEQDTSETTSESKISAQSSSEQAQDTANATGTPAASASLCGVCHLNPPKYKCPRCYLPYCSVACNRIHRENHPPDPEPAIRPTVPSTPPTDTPTQQSRVPDPNNPFRALDTSQKLKYLFQKYPNLPDQLLKIHAATLPPSDAGPDSRLPASLMKGITRNNKWNHDVGLRNGKDALRKARKADGEEGKAIREYSELILHLLNDEQESQDATAILQQQAATDDVRLIERLMAEEKR
ncbi:Zinc finger HIT domain-containing protein [Paramyrothecium foliicola]|nr:Zinc finger HIT domain-containing protein [Paramyrothecium foliicola]